MKKYTYLAYILFLMVSLVACQENNDLVEGNGYLQISSVDLDKTIVPQTKGADDKILALDIIKDGAIVKHVGNWTTIQSESIILPVGNYVLKAYSADIDLATEGQGLDVLPYYAGQVAVTVEKDKAKTVSITCTLAQSMVTLSYSDNFKSAFSAFSSTVSNTHGNVTIPSTVTKAAYFIAGSALNLTVELTNTDNKAFTYTKKIVDNAQSRYHYKVKLDVTNEGSGSFTFEIDDETNEYRVNIGVPTAPTEDLTLETEPANAWGKFAYLYGTYTPAGSVDSTEPVSFLYRKLGDTNWISVEATLENNKYVAKTEELSFATTYEYRISRENKVGNLQTFSTESYQEIPNMNLDAWSSTQVGLLTKKTCWFANAVAGGNTEAGAYWTTGNPGTTMIGKESVTKPTDDAVSGKAAELKTVTGVMVAGSAAGNLVIGKFETNISDPKSSITFGRPYTGARPVKFSGWFKYTPKAINNGSVPADASFTMDEGQIYIQLWDADDNVIAYGEKMIVGETSTYTRFDIDIDYSDLTAKPAKIMILATSSRYGGEFSGTSVVGKVGNGSTLWVDEFELSYF